MDITKAIKLMLTYKDRKNIEVAEGLGYTKQGFSNLLKKNNFKVSDVEKIANILDYDVEIHFIDRSGTDNITLN